MAFRGVQSLPQHHLAKTLPDDPNRVSAALVRIPGMPLLMSALVLYLVESAYGR